MLADARGAEIRGRAIRGALFDVDGVAVDTAGLHARAWAGALEAPLARLGRGPAAAPLRPEEAARHLDGRSREDGVRALLAARGLSVPDGGPADAPGALTIAGIAKDKDRRYRALLEDGGAQAFEDARALLYRLREAGVAVAAVSASRHATQVLRDTGLRGLFDAVVDGVEAARLRLAGRPDPALLLEAARRLGVEPGECLIIEDAAAGVAAARQAGVGLVVLVRRDEAHSAVSDADVTVVSLRDLLDDVA